MPAKSKTDSRKKRHRAIRKRIEGNTERPRLAVFRSTRHIYAQVIDDLSQKTLVSTSDVDADKGTGKKKDRAKQVGAAIAKKCLEKGSTRSSSIELVTNITDASPRSPTARAKPASSSSRQVR